MLQQGVSRGAAFGDIDNDGDVDILINVNSGPARLLLNEHPARNWLAVAIDGPGLGWGTRVEVKAGGLPAQVRWVQTDASYLSASDARVSFGLGSAARVESIKIEPRDAPARIISGDGVKINSILRIPTPSR